MKIADIIAEAETSATHVVFHGSPYPKISKFRLDNVRHRTGTPGTLSFTTDIENTKNFGPHVYEVHVQGNFGDYRVPEDVEKVFAWRLPEHLRVIAPRLKPGELEAQHDEIAGRLHREIAAGQYALWENVSLWRRLGWDGAWCLEAGYRNLIINNLDCIRAMRELS